MRLFIPSLAGLVLSLGCQPRTFNTAEPQDPRLPDAALADEAFHALQDRNYTAEVDAFLNRAADANTAWSVDIRALGPNGEKYILYRRDSTRPVRPASTLKIFTAWAYFHLFPEVAAGRGDYEQVKLMMKESDNDMAEAYLSEAAAKIGSRDKVVQLFREHGINGVFPVDGSGLSYENRVNAFSLVKTLWTIRAGEYRDNFRQLLPIGSVDGTLDQRPLLKAEECGGRVTAKTGTLTDDPSADLAGFADGPGGWLMVFALLGDSVSSVEEGRSAIDRTVCRSLKAIRANLVESH